MLSEEQVNKLTPFKGRRRRVQEVVLLLGFSDRKNPNYREVCEEVRQIISRNIEISIRCNADELEKIKIRAAAAGHARVAEFIREAALHADIETMDRDRCCRS
jgi:predicted DNA binding CopG/RHH family protein